MSCAMLAGGASLHAKDSEIETLIRDICVRSEYAACNLASGMQSTDPAFRGISRSCADHILRRLHSAPGFSVTQATTVIKELQGSQLLFDHTKDPWGVGGAAHVRFGGDSCCSRGLQFSLLGPLCKSNAHGKYTQATLGKSLCNSYLFEFVSICCPGAD